LMIASIFFTSPPGLCSGAGVMPNQGRIWKAVARKVD
jgi:hypothetical protein